MIRTENLTKRYRRNEALHELTLEVPEGSVFALVGPNGAGKSTAIKVAMNILQPSAGRAEILGVDSRALGAEQLAQIGYVSENQRLPEWMKTGYFFDYCKAFYPTWNDGDLAALVRAYDLPLDRSLKALSRGMKVKAALAASLAYRPRLIVLDEPFSGLDVLVREQLIESIVERTPETTVLISSHDLAEIESFATHVGYLSEGRLQFTEEMGALTDRFREIEITLENAGELPRELPRDWLNPEQSGAAVRFTDSHYDAARSRDEIRRRFGQVRDIEARQIPFRSIFLALGEIREEVLMKLAMHTFKKDARRLWPGVAISLALLTMLARTDRWRSDSLVGSTEGWLNLVLPLAWACLIGLAVLEEPLAGDRHFWLTRPHRWPDLLASKLLFALLFVHLPTLVADSYVLATHGFSPFGWLPQLLGKQVMLAAAVTLPAMALAALVGGFTHFMMLLFAVAALAIFVSGAALGMTPPLQRPEDYLRNDIVASIVAIAAIAIVGLQYRRRKAAIARTVAIVIALITGVVFGYVPETFDYRVRAVLHPAARLALGVGQGKPDVPPGMAPGRRETIAVPVALSGVPAGALYHIGRVDLSIRTPDGKRYQSTIFSPDNQYEKVLLDAGLYRFPYDLESAPLVLLLRFDRALYQTLKEQHVRASGRIPVSFYRLGETAWMPMHGHVAAPGVGHCSSSISETRYSESMVKVLCESPSALPRSTRVTLTIPGVERQWHERLGNFGGYTTGPRWAWLSPLDRGKTFFNISDPRTRRYQPYFEVPLEQLDQAKIGITPEIPTGYTMVDFELPDIALADNRVRPQSER